MTDIEKEVKGLESELNKKKTDNFQNKEKTDSNQKIENRPAEKTFTDILRKFRENLLEHKDIKLEKYILDLYKDKQTFEDKIQRVSFLINALDIKPPYTSRGLENIFFKINETINELKEKGVLSKEEEMTNFLNESYIKSIVKTAKEKGVNITENEIYLWAFLKPVYEYFDLFKETVVKELGISEEEFNMHYSKERDGIDYLKAGEYKDQIIKNFADTIDILPFKGPMSYLFAVQRAEENGNTLLDYSKNLFLFDQEDAYKKLGYLKNNQIFNIFVREDILSALLKIDPLMDRTDILKIKEYGEKYEKNKLIPLIGETGLVFPGFYLKDSILKEIKSIIKSEKGKKALDEILKIKNELREKVQHYELTETSNGWIVGVESKKLEEIKKNNYNLVYDEKNNELYYYDEFDEKHTLPIINSTLKEIYENDRKIIKEGLKIESKKEKDFENSFIKGVTCYSIDPEKEEAVFTNEKEDFFLTESLTKRVPDETITIDKNLPPLLKSNFDISFFEKYYGKFSKEDAYSELKTFVKQRYGLSSSEEAIEKIKKEKIGVLVLDKSKKDLENYKNNALKALALVKTGAFLNKDGTLKEEFATFQKNFMDVLTREEISFFEEETDKQLTHLQEIQKKVSTYEELIDSATKAFSNKIVEFSKNFLPKGYVFTTKKDLLKDLEKRKNEISPEEELEYLNTVALLKQFIKREEEITKKVQKHNKKLSFIKTLLERSTDLSLTNFYEEKETKIMGETVKDHFFSKIFSETEKLAENFFFKKKPDFSKEIPIFSSSTYGLNVEAFLKSRQDISSEIKAEKVGDFIKSIRTVEDSKVLMLNTENHNFYIPEYEYNSLEKDLISLEDAQAIFEELIKENKNFASFQKKLEGLKTGDVTYNAYLNKELFFSPHISKIIKREFIKTKLHTLEFYYPNITETAVDNLPDKGIDNLYEKYKEAVGEKTANKKYAKFIEKYKNEKIYRSVKKIVDYIGTDVIKDTYKVGKKYKLSSEKMLEILKNYSFLQLLEEEFRIREEVFKELFEEGPNLKTIKDMEKFLRKRMVDIEKSLEKTPQDKKKIKKLNFYSNLFLIISDEENQKNIDFKDIKKFLSPRENLADSIKLFKEHLVERTNQVEEAEKKLFAELQTSFETIKTAKYNEYIGMYEQLKNLKKQGYFSYEIEKILDKIFFSQIDDTLIEGYKNRLTEQQNAFSNLNSLYSDIVFTATKRAYDSIGLKKKIENFLTLNKKILVPFLVKMNEKESAVFTIKEDELERIFSQYKKITKKFKEFLGDEKGNIVIPDNTLTEEEKTFLNQLLLLEKLNFPHNTKNQKKKRDIINAIVKLMFTVNDTPLFAKEDIKPLRDNNGLYINASLKEKFPNLFANIDSELSKIKFNVSDLSDDKEKKIEQEIKPNLPQKDLEDRESYMSLFQDLENKLLTITTEIDTLESRMKTVKSDMLSLRNEYERMFNERLKNNHAFNGSAFENAFNIVRYPLLIFEAFQIGVEGAKKIVGEYFDYRRKIVPIREEINKRKKELVFLMGEAEKTEEKIAFEIKEFYMDFFSQNYSTVQEMGEIIEKSAKKGNKFAKHLISSKIVEKDTNGNYHIDMEKFNNELKQAKSILTGVYKTGRTGYRNIESLTRARDRIKAIFAESQPNIFSVLLGGNKNDIIMYDDIVDARITKMFSSEFEIKENAKKSLVGNIGEKPVKEILKYTDFNKTLDQIKKFKNSFLIRGENRNLLILELDETTLSELSKTFKYAKNGESLDIVLENALKFLKVHTIDYNDAADVTNTIKNLGNNSELIKKIEKELLTTKKVNKITEREKKEIEQVVIKSLISPEILSDNERKVLAKVKISFAEIDDFMERNKFLIKQSLSRINFNTIKRFFGKEKRKMPSPVLIRILEDVRKVKKGILKEKDFEKKYNLTLGDIERIKKQIKKEIVDLLINNINLEEYSKNSNNLFGGKLSATTMLLAEDGNGIADETSSFIKNIMEKVKNIKDFDESRNIAVANLSRAMALQEEEKAEKIHDFSL